MPGMKFEIEKHIKYGRVVRVSDLSTMVSTRTLGHLRRLRVVELPEGLEIIGEGWFADSNVEKAIISASVREIQKGAFACCKKLRQVEFAERSALELIGELCFYNTGLESITIPS